MTDPAVRAEARAQFARGEILIEHGTWNAYHFYKCRCPECRSYESDRKRTQRAEAQRAFQAGEIDIEHGNPRGNTFYGCPCDLCRAAEAERRRRYPRYR